MKRIVDDEFVSNVNELLNKAKQMEDINEGEIGGGYSIMFALIAMKRGAYVKFEFDDFLSYYHPGMIILTYDFKSEKYYMSVSIGPGCRYITEKDVIHFDKESFGKEYCDNAQD